MRAHDYIADLAVAGRYCFTSRDAREALDMSADATKLALGRLARKKHVASPARGFHVILPPEYRSLGCLPAEQFVPELMRWLNQPYYAGLLSAVRLPRAIRSGLRGIAKRHRLGLHLDIDPRLARSCLTRYDQHPCRDRPRYEGPGHRSLRGRRSWAASAVEGQTRADVFPEIAVNAKDYVAQSTAPPA